jgi:hypothetical protein
MATWQSAGYEHKGYLGRILLALGSVALVADLAFLAESLAQLLNRAQEGLFGLMPTLGLSLLHAAGAIALDQVDYFSLSSRILVLFTAMVAVIGGIALLRSPSARATHAVSLPASAFRERETQ